MSTPAPMTKAASDVAPGDVLVLPPPHDGVVRRAMVKRVVRVVTREIGQDGTITEADAIRIQFFGEGPDFLSPSRDWHLTLAIRGTP